MPQSHRPERPRTALATDPARAAPLTRRPRAAAAGVTIGAIALCVIATSSPSAHAQPSAPEDWPCVQALIPEVNPGVIWPLPIGEEIAGSWRESPETAALARRLGEAEALDETLLAAVDAFAGGVPEPEREAALTRLADGTVSVANERRSLYLDGIRRYTRQQIAIAGQIESTLNRLATLDEAEANDEPSLPAAERAEIRETLDWHTRLYDQRERSIRALCERPVELEQQLAATLRELAYRLPGA